MLRIFPQSSFTPCLSVFSPNAGKCGPEQLQILTVLRLQFLLHLLNPFQLIMLFLYFLKTLATGGLLMFLMFTDTNRKMAMNVRGLKYVNSCNIAISVVLCSLGFILFIFNFQLTYFSPVSHCCTSLNHQIFFGFFWSISVQHCLNSCLNFSKF